MVALTFKLLLLCLPSVALSTSFQQERGGRELGCQIGSKQIGIKLSHGYVDIERRSLEEIYQAALKENGTLRIGWGGDDQESLKDIIDAFAAKYPGIEPEILMNLSKYIDSNIDNAFKETNGTDNGVDMAILQTVASFPIWKREGRLLPYKVIPWNDIYPQFVDKDGAYLGTYIFTFGPHVYNPRVTNNYTLPKSYLDHLLPTWSNKIILTYPNDDDAVLYLFKLIIDKYGVDYIHALQKQNTTWVRGTATPSILIANTNPQNDIDPQTGLLNSQSISFTSSSAFTSGVAVQAFPDVRMTWPQTGAIFATTKMPESAKLFLNFLMDDFWQGLVSEGSFATRRKFDKVGIFNQSDLDPLGYGTFMADFKQVQSLRFLLEELIGTPAGKNPVDVW